MSHEYFRQREDILDVASNQDDVAIEKQNPVVFRRPTVARRQEERVGKW